MPEKKDKKTTQKKKIEEIGKIEPEKVVKKLEKNEETLPKEILEDPNCSPIFDVFLYRELFTSLREKLDILYERREKSEKDSDAYDDAVYNLTSNAVTEAGAQDFLSYCYKKGKYDFCLLNYEKYMKWLLLAASSGNAFSLSKLQIFLTNAVEDILTLDNHSYLIDFLELEPENYFVFLSKLLCDEIVKILNISAESLIKLPETYQEETEQLLKLFDNTKQEATRNVKSILKNAIDQLIRYVEEQKKLEQQNKKSEINEEKFVREEKIKEEKEISNQENREESPQPKAKKPRIKKFRY
jgi:hypothetical protein